MLAKKDNYDIVIVGSGLSGQAAAAEAVSKGLKLPVVEKDELQVDPVIMSKVFLQ